MFNEYTQRRRFRNGQRCPRQLHDEYGEDRGPCPGIIKEVDHMMVCQYCGRVYWESPRTIYFSDLLDGEWFTVPAAYENYNDGNVVWVKGRPPKEFINYDPNALTNQPWWWEKANRYQRHHPDRWGSCGPGVKVLRIGDRHISQHGEN